VVVELHFCLVIELFVFVENGALRAHLVSGVLAAAVPVRRRDALVVDADRALFAILEALGSERLDLFDD
jgi:hypothetical protein